ncbi:MAG: hypothetical protein GPJ54_05540 [Candidatus Heimdallarchaeota archaeon]|nr:hypothetical protein [Candidatus Heimdallarchaeota archaeon]
MASPFFDEFRLLIADVESPHLLIFLHNNADPDALGAGFGLAELSKKINPSLSYSIHADGLNQSSMNALRDLNLEIIDLIPELPDNVFIVFLDTANIIQLGKYKEWIDEAKYPKIVIDHHSTKEISNDATLCILEENAASTCIMLAKAFNSLEIKPSHLISTLLLMGHIYDSRRYFYGVSEESFQLSSFLIKNGGDYEKANEYLQNQPSSSEKIARMKAFQRIKYKNVNGYIVATSHIGAFEASVARSIIAVGADIVMVISGKKNELRGSARCRSGIDLNIAEIVEQISHEFGGVGGGHKNAAGFNIKKIVSKKTQKELLSRFFNIIGEKLKSV